MSRPTQNATPAELAKLAKLNEKLYGPKSGTGSSKGTPAEMGRSMDAPAKSSVSNSKITGYLAKNPGMSDKDIRGAMDKYGVSTKQMSEATGTNFKEVQDRYDRAGSRPTPPTPPKPTPPMPPKPTPPMPPRKPVDETGRPQTATPPKFTTPTPRPQPNPVPAPTPTMKKGGSVAKASSRGDGIAQRGKTKGRMC
jgi:hypothetical protein